MRKAYSTTPGEDPPRVADHVLELLNRPAGERRAIAARAKVEDLAWERQLAPMFEILSEAADGAHVARSA